MTREFATTQGAPTESRALWISYVGIELATCESTMFASVEGFEVSQVATSWRGVRTLPIASLLLAGLGPSGADARDRLQLELTTLQLPGAPTVVLPADLNHDGLQDLVVAVAYTEWDQIGIEEWSEMNEVEGLVMVMTVVPRLMDRREIRVYLARAGGGYDARIPPLALDLSVLSLDSAPDPFAVIALTDEGVSTLELRESHGDLRLVLEPLLSAPPVLAGSGALVPNLGLTRDVDGDGLRDLLLPIEEGLAVLPASRISNGATAVDLARLPGNTSWLADGVTRYYPLPEIRDVNGDGLADLIVPDRRRQWQRFHVLENMGGGQFGEAFVPTEVHTPGTDAPDAGGHESFPIVYFGDLDGDGVAEYVSEEDLEDPNAGWRREIKEAKRPPRRYRIHRSRADLSMEPEPSQSFEALGYALDNHDEDSSSFQLPGGFRDLDNDGRQDLISLTLDFSLLQAVKILTTQRIGVGLDFHVWCQDEQGRFNRVEGLDLSGKLKLDLENLKIGQLSQFEGDFDGDGRIDFLQLGRGKTVTIHRGREGCRYPTRPDLTLRLKQPPLDLALVRVMDLNGDQRSDLMIVQPESEPEPGVSSPIRLELYLSPGTR